MDSRRVVKRIVATLLWTLAFVTIFYITGLWAWWYGLGRH